MRLCLRPARLRGELACVRVVYSGPQSLDAMPYGEELQQVLQSARQSLKEVLDEVHCDAKPAKSLSRCNRSDLLQLCCLTAFSPSSCVKDVG